MPNTLHNLYQLMLSNPVKRCAAILLALLMSVGAAHADAQSTTAPDSAPRFSEYPAPAAAREPLTLVFSGDNLLGSRMSALIAKHGVDWPYAEVREALSAADIAFGNLECPITDYAHSTPGKSLASIKAGRNFIFKADPAYSGRLLADAGYDIVSLANNHAMDYCEPGMLDTLAALDGAGVLWVGAGRNEAEAAQARVVEVHGWRVGYIAYTLIVPAASQAGVDSAGANTLAKAWSPALAGAIGELKQQVDVVVVSFHWGKESSRLPAKYQRDIAHHAIEAGATIIAGHHTHCPQGIELYKGGVIAYSLGNFLFTGKSSLLDSFILRVELSDPPAGDPPATPAVSASLLPVWVRGGRPEPASDQRLLNKLKAVLKNTGSTLTTLAGSAWFAVEPR